jgi:CBS domain-containing protein
MNASDVMTHAVLSVRPDAAVADAIRMMLDNRISGLPVIDDSGRLVGILTEGDLLRRGETGTERHRPRWLEILMGPGRLAEEYVRTHGRKIGELMTRDPVCVAPGTPLKEIVELMERRRIKRVPVLDGEVIVGILSRADLLRGLAGVLEEAPPAATSDEEIRERILAELARAAWVPRDGIAITVENGVVDLNGVILDEHERAALRVAAENVPGVKAVEDHLVWVEPVSGTVIDAPSRASTAEIPATGPARPPR